jgi:hypothetical protein
MPVENKDVLPALPCTIPIFTPYPRPAVERRRVEVFVEHGGRAGSSGVMMTLGR